MGREEREKEGWGGTDGRIFQGPRAKELKQETGEGLSSNPSTVMVVVFPQKLRATIWLVECFLIGASFGSYQVV